MQYGSTRVFFLKLICQRHYYYREHSVCSQHDPVVRTEWGYKAALEFYMPWDSGGRFGSWAFCYFLFSYSKW